ncbi:MAG: hypothetical protein JW798_09760 [Prolixibacteraceae bacterium]|nr:hypothetical protein [Prolixibacteraceae bacterium]
MNNSFDYSNIKPLTLAIPSVSAKWTGNDFANAVKVRWGIGRNNSKITPGIYKIGNPNSQSDIFVSANYKLSFDILRKNLNAFDAWILVIDTKGVNVWCAAGKGTFGTENLVRSINKNSIKDIVTHRRLIVPQLGAVGVAAYKIMELTGFRVIFGPVRASDISEFVKAGYKATPGMRRVDFPFYERAKLIPVDLVYWKYRLIAALFVVFLFSGLDRSGFLFSKMFQTSLFPVLNILTGYFAGIVITPLLLPVFPVRAFSLKGALCGLIFIAILNWFFIAPTIERIALGLIGIAVASFTALNFTGATTYTSLSGVKLEMKWAIPFQIGFAAVGLLLFIISKLI